MFFKEIIPDKTKRLQVKMTLLFGALVVIMILVLSFVAVKSSEIATSQQEKEILFGASAILILLSVIIVSFISNALSRERLRLNKERKEHKTWLKNIVKYSPLGIVFTDKNGTMQYANPKFIAMTGFAMNECIGKNVNILKSGIQNKQFYKELWQTIRKGENWNGEIANRKKDGTLYWEEMSIAPIADENNRITHFVATKKDITDEKQLHRELLLANSELNEMTETLKMREQNLEKMNEQLTILIKKEAENILEKDKLLMQQSKMAVMGEMIGMIAHQWRQPLNAVSAATIKINMLNELGVLKSEELSKTLKFIQDMSQKMSATINDFMDFSKPDREKERVNVKDVLENVFKIIDAQLTTRNIVFNIDIEENIHLLTYKKELAHILLNLLSNARDAFENKEMPDKIITVRACAKGDHIIINVIDNAGGIKGEILPKIFDPFFTTKPVGKGTGLGLYMSKKMLEEHFDGVISVTNRESGAEFTIVLPNTESSYELYLIK